MDLSMILIPNDGELQSMIKVQFIWTLMNALDDSVTLACYEAEHLIETVVVGYHGMKEVLVCDLHVVWVWLVVILVTILW